MKIYYSLLIIIFFIYNGNAQIINHSNQLTPRGTFEVKASGNSMWYDGIIFPKITSLTASNSILSGMLAFYDTSEKKKAGVYFYNNNQWNPFYSSNMIGLDMSTAVYTVSNDFYEVDNNTIVTITKGSANNRAIRVKLDSNPNSIAANHPEIAADRIFTVTNNGNIRFRKVGQYLVSVNLVIDISMVCSVDYSERPSFRQGIELEIYQNSSQMTPIIGSVSAAANFYEGYEKNVTRYNKLNISFAGRINVTNTMLNDEFVIRGKYKRLEPDDAPRVGTYTFKVNGSESTVTAIKLK